MVKTNGWLWFKMPLDKNVKHDLGVVLDNSLQILINTFLDTVIMSTTAFRLLGNEISNTVDFSQLYQIEELKQRISYNLVLEKGEDNWILAHCKELGVHTQGSTEKEAIRNAIEAIELMVGIDKEFSLIIRKIFSV